MEGPRLYYPGPERFEGALGHSPVDSWIEARREPHWYRPATLCVCAALVRQPSGRRSVNGWADDWIRVQRLQREMALFARKHGGQAGVTQMYWSAGVVQLTERAMLAVHAALVQSFDLKAGARFTARLGAGSPKHSPLAALRELGVTTVHTRAAFDSAHSLERFVGEVRDAGFDSVAFEIPMDVSGVPMRKVREYVAALCACRPSRILLIPPCGARRSEPLADCDAGGRQVCHAIYGMLIANGYEYVAHHLFAVPTDDLAKAKRIGTLIPTPVGYCGCPSHVSIAIGQGAIGNIGAMHYRNARDARSYVALLQREALPIERAYVSTRVDLARRAVITGLLTHFCVEIESIESAYRLDFGERFRRELIALERLEKEGVVECLATQVRLTSAGRFACGRIANIFARGGTDPDQLRVGDAV